MCLEKRSNFFPVIPLAMRTVTVVAVEKVTWKWLKATKETSSFLWIRSFSTNIIIKKLNIPEILNFADLLLHSSPRYSEQFQKMPLKPSDGNQWPYIFQHIRISILPHFLIVSQVTGGTSKPRRFWRVSMIHSIMWCITWASINYFCWPEEKSLQVTSGFLVCPTQLCPFCPFATALTAWRWLWNSFWDTDNASLNLSSFHERPTKKPKQTHRVCRYPAPGAHSRSRPWSCFSCDGWMQWILTLWTFCVLCYDTATIYNYNILLLLFFPQLKPVWK